MKMNEDDFVDWLLSGEDSKETVVELPPAAEDFLDAFYKSGYQEASESDWGPSDG